MLGNKVETDEVLVIPSLEGDHTTSLSKENILKSLYAKTRQKSSGLTIYYTKIK